MDLSISPSESGWQVGGRPLTLKPALFQPINTKDGVTDTHAKV